MNEKLIVKRKFFDSLKRGTGEAYLIARDNPTIDFSEFIIKGALINYAFDGQSEDSRAEYIYDLVSLSSKKDKIRKTIFQGLANERNDTWNLTHLFDLVKIYAYHGNLEAKQVIYDRFLHEPIEGSDWVGYSEILEIDGFEGLLYIAEKFGKWIEKHPDDWQDDSIINHFQDDNPQINVYQELESAAKENRFIKIYLNNLIRTEESRKNHIRETPSYTDLIDEVLNRTPFFPYKRKMELSDREVSEIAERLLVEKNKVRLEKLLDVFDCRKFPFDSEFILRLAKQRPDSRNRISEYATSALKFLSSDNIRQFALDKIPKSKRPERYIDILYSNYRSGDYQLLVEMARRFKNDYIIENLSSSYINIYETNKTPECKEPLEELYSKMNCGIHRCALIEVLIINNVLSDRIKGEIQYDSYLPTRELFNEKQNVLL